VPVGDAGFDRRCAGGDVTFSGRGRNPGELCQTSVSLITELLRNSLKHVNINKMCAKVICFL